MSIDIGYVAPIIVGTVVGGTLILLGLLAYSLAKAAGDADDKAGRPRG